ncbi:hypothetical protein N7448_009885 [Penicillium atrosanguineum]|uniref:Uncharacterized protein n=1 Tax=Penicillium atrosanguineum TaxID=1132637 RepID=A0A9W9KX21_9EURO|nr:hypothetical protein N7448_009885 [Penicillium atrosanguineum]KAJ5320721.1 hypothetical protein N7476_003723 [Penicillium atrosanguineum]
MGFHYITVVSLTMFVLALAFPRETGQGGKLDLAHATTTASPPAVTEDANLLCTDGSSILYTTDCTMGTPVSYCWKAPPQITCGTGEFPSVWHPGHCEEAQTCFPVTAPWITTKCSNGATPYSTSTLYDGTLAGGQSTVITSVSCVCAPDQWYSMTISNGGSQIDTFCMPHDSCPPGMTTSVSTNTYCASATDSAAVSACSGISLESNYCNCGDPNQTPVYPEQPGATATGCAN